MSILEEIKKWAINQPNWQQDAIARLYANHELSGYDLDDLYALLKAEHGILDPENRVAGRLATEQVSAPPTPHQLIQLVAIKDLENVNAIAEGQRLPIEPSGLTVIYGENGTGKSGYSRVLKKACRARDQREPILPDANKESGKAGSAQASFEILNNGVANTVSWTDGHPSPDELSEISIFDSHCARAYVDNQGDFSYIPYGLDILEGLVRVCNKLRERVKKELNDSKTNVEIFSNLSKTPTKVGTLLTRLSSKTKFKDVEALATLTEVEVERLATLVKTLAEADPKQKAQVLRLKSTRFGHLANRIGDAISAIGNTKLSKLQSLIEKSKAAAQAAEIGANIFKEVPDLLPGTGGEPWKTLFEAARIFSTESHVGKDFPHLGPKAACPLCQNLLGEIASERLVIFDSFVQQESEKAAKAAQADSILAYETVKQANLDLAIDEALRKELEAWLPGLAESCSKIQTVLRQRHQAICEAVENKMSWNDIPKLLLDPRKDLESAKAQLMIEAKTLEESADEKTKAAMISERTELEARQRLSEMKSLVLDTITTMVLHSKLKSCANACTTTGISQKSTKLAKTMATPQVAEALNAELKALNVHELQVTMRNESPSGKTQFKLILELPGGNRPSDILSEGERRAIAIASFLAEVNLGGSYGGIVFDDPVSSLDHRRRWQVARRLAEEATKRQVIIFTHDIYFLCILQQEAEDIGLPLLTQCIRKSPNGFGTQTNHLPFDALGTKKRIKELRTMHEEVLKAHNAGDEETAKTLTCDAYHHLRLAWERGVEEVLLQGVVSRFVEGVSTRKLRYVVVEDDDYKTIDAGMTKSSKFAHDSAMNAILPTPYPDELLDDIEAIEVWRMSVEKRKKTVFDRR